MTEPVNWELAARVASRVAGSEPFARSYHYAALQADFDEATARAELMVAESTGLASLAGPARARVADRPQWVRANVESFRRLLSPLTRKIAERPMAAPVAAVGRNIAGLQVGTLLGWMSTRVLGQYDLLLVEDERPEDQDVVYYVGPNVISLEKRYAFPPAQFRLWLALHEVTHRAQFTGIPWMRDYFVGLVNQTMSGVDPDPRRLVEGLRRTVEEVRAGRNPLADGGLLAILAGDEQVAVLRKVQALMSLLEGHGDVTMDRAASGLIPEAERFARVLRQRRQQHNAAARALQQLLGIEAKLRQYEMGERFIAAVEAAAGPDALQSAWKGPDYLPTMDEIRDPARWVARVDGPSAAAV
ncbi:MAG TPA: zinc-dependent metalloprotease [Acidimicrobiales bacterium]|nr:zinc-dependent metalloprotease [Acidimicrobiales bacterium]